MSSAHCRYERVSPPSATCVWLGFARDPFGGYHKRVGLKRAARLTCKVLLIRSYRSRLKACLSSSTVPSLSDTYSSAWQGVLRLLVQEWTDRNCAIITANNFSGQYTGTSRTSPVQSAVSVRKSTLNRPFICPIPIESQRLGGCGWTLGRGFRQCVRSMH